MTKTVTETDAQSIDHAISGGYLALADNGDVIWAETKFARYGCISAADLAMAWLAGICGRMGWHRAADWLSARVTWSDRAIAAADWAWDRLPRPHHHGARTVADIDFDVDFLCA